LLKEEEPPDTGGGRVFSLDAALGLLATRRRLGRRGYFFAMACHALGFCGVGGVSCNMYEEFKKI